jgi:hypothetical protein
LLTIEEKLSDHEWGKDITLIKDDVTKVFEAVSKAETTSREIARLSPRTLIFSPRE